MKYAKLLAFALGGLLISGCARDFVPGGGSGRLSVDLSTDATVEQVSTRAEEGEEGEEEPAPAPMPGLVAPEKEEFTLKIMQGGADGTQVWSGVFTEYDETFQLATGAYTAVVSCGDPGEEGFELPAFGATKGFDIENDDTTPVEMTAKLVNMAVTVKYSEALKGYFTEYKATLFRGEIVGKTVTVDDVIAVFEKDEERAAFLDPKQGGFYIKLEYTLPWNGVEKRVKTDYYLVDENIAAATHLQVKFDAKGEGIGTADDIEIIWKDMVPVDLGEIEVAE